jgi:hypothetical protein
MHINAIHKKIVKERDKINRKKMCNLLCKQLADVM